MISSAFTQFGYAISYGVYWLKIHCHLLTKIDILYSRQLQSEKSYTLLILSPKHISFIITKLLYSLKHLMAIWPSFYIMWYLVLETVQKSIYFSPWFIYPFRNCFKLFRKHSAMLQELCKDFTYFIGRYSFI